MYCIYIFTLSVVLYSWVAVQSENLDVSIEVNISNSSTEDLDTRRHYGLSVHDQCKNYAKTFKCLSACKARGYEVFRMNYACKCTCHPMVLSEKKYFSPKVHRTTAKLPTTIFPWTTPIPPTTAVTFTKSDITAGAEGVTQSNSKSENKNDTLNKKKFEGSDGKNLDVTDGSTEALVEVAPEVSTEETPEAPTEDTPEAPTDETPEAPTE